MSGTIEVAKVREESERHTTGGGWIVTGLGDEQRVDDASTAYREANRRNDMALQELQIRVSLDALADHEAEAFELIELRAKAARLVRIARAPAEQDPGEQVACIKEQHDRIAYLERARFQDREEAARLRASRDRWWRRCFAARLSERLDRRNTVESSLRNLREVVRSLPDLSKAMKESPTLKAMLAAWNASQSAEIDARAAAEEAAEAGGRVLVEKAERPPVQVPEDADTAEG